jgi:hypothetical protein
MEVLAKHPRSGLSHCPSGSAIECLPVATRHQAIAVVFDLVNPIGTRRRTLGSRRQAGLDEAERRGTLQLRLVISMCEFARNYGAKTVDLAVASTSIAWTALATYGLPLAVTWPCAARTADIFRSEMR